MVSSVSIVTIKSVWLRHDSLYCEFVRSRQNASFGTFKPKLIDCSVHNHCLNFLENCDFSPFWRKMVQFSISEEILRADFAAKNRSILWTGLRHFLTVSRFLRNSGPLKIRLLQLIIVICILNIGVICNFN